MTGFEPALPTLTRWCSTVELHSQREVPWEDSNLSRFARRDGNSRPDLSRSHLTEPHDAPNAVAVFTG